MSSFVHPLVVEKTLSSMEYKNYVHIALFHKLKVNGDQFGCQASKMTKSIMEGDHRTHTLYFKFPEPMQKLYI